jgi:hypothetical protein
MPFASGYQQLRISPVNAYEIDQSNDCKHETNPTAMPVKTKHKWDSHKRQQKNYKCTTHFCGLKVHDSLIYPIYRHGYMIGGYP